MPEILPWSVAGVSAQTREAARAAARRAGLSIGEWLEQRLAAPPSPTGGPPLDGLQPTEPTADISLDGEPLLARIEQRLQAIELRIETAEATQAEDMRTMSGTITRTATMLHNQGQIVDRLVAQFVTLSQRLENETTAVTGGDKTLAADLVALTEQIATQRREAKAQSAAMSIGLAALDDKLARLRTDCAEAFAALDERQALPAPQPESPPEPVYIRQLAEPPTFATYSPLDDAAEPPPPEDQDDGPQDRSPQNSPTASLRTAPMRPQAEEDAEDEPGRKRPLALLILILAAALVAASGLLLSRQPEILHWYHGLHGTPTTTTTRPPVPGAKAVHALTAQAEQAQAKPAQTKPAQAAPPQSAPPDPQTRLKNLAVGGNAKAALVLGLQLLPADPASAVNWLQLAAKDGDAIAQYRLGDLYERGVGVTADPVHAVRLFQSSAGKGNVAAMTRLAAAFAAGAGAKRDYAGAAHWFARAAKYGQRDPQFNLAVLYEQGRGVPHDLSQAYTWYAIAAAAGDAESRSRLGVLVGQLSAEERRTAKAAADAFAPQSLDKTANTAPKAVDVLK